MNLIILKTDLKTKKKVQSIKSVFDRHECIQRWSIDTEDIDNVLRIEAERYLTETDVVRLMANYGFYGEQMED